MLRLSGYVDALVRLHATGGCLMKKRALTLLWVLLYPVSCTAVAGGAFVILEPEPEPVAADAVPGNFPVLVLVGGADGGTVPYLVENGELAGFLESHPEHEFLVRPSESDALSARLVPGPPLEGRPAWSIAFAVEEEHPDRQVIRAELSWDDDRVNVGWYEATAAGVRPLRHQSYFGPGVAMAALPVAVVVTTTLYLLAGWWARARRRGAPTKAAASS